MNSLAKKVIAALNAAATSCTVPTAVMGDQLQCRCIRVNDQIFESPRTVFYHSSLRALSVKAENVSHLSYKLVGLKLELLVRSL